MTDRLVLLPFSPAMAQAVLAGDVSEHRVASGYPHRDTPDIAHAIMRDPEVLADTTWIITTKADGEIIGDCGWFRDGESTDTVEIGYGLAESARRQGFASEAVAAVVEHAWSIGVARIVATTDDENVASVRVLEKLGFGLVASEGGQRRYELDRP